MERSSSSADRLLSVASKCVVVSDRKLGLLRQPVIDQYDDFIRFFRNAARSTV